MCIFCSCILQILDEGPFTFWGYHHHEIYEVPPYWGLWVLLLWGFILMRVMRLWGATLMRLTRYQPHGTPALGNDTPRDQCSFNSESFVVVTSPLFPHTMHIKEPAPVTFPSHPPAHTKTSTNRRHSLWTTVPRNAILSMLDSLECLFCAPLYACFSAISTTTKQQKIFKNLSF